jgi:hypothetical protein
MRGEEELRVAAPNHNDGLQSNRLRRGEMDVLCFRLQYTIENSSKYTNGLADSVIFYV